MMNINFRMERRDSQNEKQGSYNTAPQFQANNGGIDSEKESGMPNSIHSQQHQQPSLAMKRQNYITQQQQSNSKEGATERSDGQDTQGSLGFSNVVIQTPQQSVVAKEMPHTNITNIAEESITSSTATVQRNEDTEESKSVAKYGSVA